MGVGKPALADRTATIRNLRRDTYRLFAGQG
jgi:hypothetical protein